MILSVVLLNVVIPLLTTFLQEWVHHRLWHFHMYFTLGQKNQLYFPIRQSFHFWHAYLWVTSHCIFRQLIISHYRALRGLSEWGAWEPVETTIPHYCECFLVEVTLPKLGLLFVHRVQEPAMLHIPEGSVIEFHEISIPFHLLFLPVNTIRYFLHLELFLKHNLRPHKRAVILVLF